MSSQCEHTYAIKVRFPGEKTFAFITPRGGTTRLRIHASQFATPIRAAEARITIAEDNPDLEVKVVRL